MQTKEFKLVENQGHLPPVPDDVNPLLADGCRCDCIFVNGGTTKRCGADLLQKDNLKGL